MTNLTVALKIVIRDLGFDLLALPQRIRIFPSKKPPFMLAVLETVSPRDVPARILIDILGGIRGYSLKHLISL